MKVQTKITTKKLAAYMKANGYTSCMQANKAYTQLYIQMHGVPPGKGKGACTNNMIFTVGQYL